MASGKAAAVGGFVLGGLALGVAAILLLGGARFFKSNLQVVVFFHDSVAGLAVGAPVTLRGVKVGTVRSMKVYLKLPDLEPVVPAVLEIEPGLVSWSGGSLNSNAADVALAVHAGLRAQLVPESLVTGQLSVNLDFHPEAAAVTTDLPGGIPEIPSIPSDVQKIKDEIADLKLPELAEKARLALDGILKIVTELDGQVGPMAGSLTRTSDAARETMETTTGAVKQIQMDATRTFGSIERLAAASQGQILTSGKEIDKMLILVERATAKADKTIGLIADMTGPNAPVRTDIEAAVRDLAASASSLRDFSHELARDPGGTLLRRPSK